MKEYIIDDNNLIGKIAVLKKIQKADPQKGREQLVHLLSRYFIKKRCKVTLFFDGFAKDSIPAGEMRIRYSDSKDADSLIKEHIDLSKNPRNLIIVSSDTAVGKYARANSCELLTAESFALQLYGAESSITTEETNHNLHSENDYFIKLFNGKD